MKFKSYVSDLLGSQTAVGIPYSVDSLNTYLDTIKPDGTTYMIAGEPGTGKSGFVDSNYLYPILWNAFNAYKKNPEQFDVSLMTIHYYTNKYLEQDKYLKLFCIYAMVQHNTVVDSSLLLGRANNHLATPDNLDEIIESAKPFFEYIEKVLVVQTGVISPATVQANLMTYLLKYYRSIKDDGVTIGYELKDEFEEPAVYLFIDTIDNVVDRENIRGSNLVVSGDDLKRSLLSMIRTYKGQNVTSIITYPIPPKPPHISKMPSYADIKAYANFTDVAMIMYNPHEHNDAQIGNYTVGSYVINGFDRLRMCYLIRNIYGNNRAAVPLIFTGENGCFREAVDPINSTAFEKQEQLLFLTEIGTEATQEQLDELLDSNEPLAIGTSAPYM